MVLIKCTNYNTYLTQLEQSDESIGWSFDKKEAKRMTYTDAVVLMQKYRDKWDGIKIEIVDEEE